MSFHVPVVSTIVVAAATILVTWLPQDSKKPEGAGMQMGGPEATPQHALLKSRVGVWDADMKMMPPGLPEMAMKGTETSKMVSDFWLVSDYAAEMSGMPFLGHGITGFDPAKKKYVGVWVDSASTNFSHGEGTFDAAGKVLTMTWEGPDPSGKIMKWRQTDEMKDADTRVFTMYMQGKDGKEEKHMLVNYKRKK